MIRACIVVAGFLLLASHVSAADAKPRMNFIVILIDDWGWTDTHVTGSDLYETPHIDKLAAAGVRFTNGYAACTVCSPTRAALLTGMYPARTRVTDWIPGQGGAKGAPLAVPAWTQKLEHRYVTLAEALHDAGYRTGIVGKWHLTPRSDDPKIVEPYYPTHHGFDVNIGGNQWGQPGAYFWPYSRGGDGLAGMTANFPKGGEKGEYLTDRFTDEAVGLIEKWKDEPFFLYLPYHAVHTPIEAKQDVTAKYQAKLADKGKRHTHARYAAMVESVDDAVGKLRASLDRLGIADRTAIVLTGDNGGLVLKGVTSNAPLRAGKGSAYEGGVRTPTFIFVPGVTPAGGVCDEPVITVDYYPTILALAGLQGDAEHNRNVDGVSLVPLLKDPRATLGRDALYWHYPHYHGGGAEPYSAIRAGDWRLVEFQHGERVELYNLADDIGESKNLAAEKPDVAAKLTKRLHDWRASVGAQMAVPK